MLKEIEHIYQRKLHNQELRSLQYLGYDENILTYYITKTFKNIYFALSVKIMLCYLKFHFK